jgi:hypothetical protein
LNDIGLILVFRAGYWISAFGFSSDLDIWFFLDLDMIDIFMYQSTSDTKMGRFEPVFKSKSAGFSP